jgi:Mrp family chromosome partitioning ATPase/capsular polysaccharide biosynthesis protein
MTATARQDAPRYATLRDYVRVVRRHRVMIAIIVLACAAASFAVTSRENKDYAASASIFFQDTTSQQLSLLGTAVGPTLDDTTRAELNESLITSAPVVRLVKRRLRSRLPDAALANAVSPAINSQNNQVEIQAVSPHAGTAQATANAFAQATKTVGASQARAQLSGLLQAVKARFRPLIAHAPDPVTKATYVDRIATLEVLAKSADPVKIVQLASLPTTPTGPRTVRNTLLGLVLGLTLALLAAFGRDAVDRRLRGAGQIGEQLGWPILGHVRESVFTAPVFFTPNGKSMAEERDREAFRMLRQNLRFLDIDNPPKSIAVTSALAEEGKSTVATALACACAASGAQTLLIDCDLRRPSIADRFGLSRGPGLADYLLGDATPADVVQVIELPALGRVTSRNGNGPSHGDGADGETGVPRRRLACITAGSRVPETAELLGSERFAAFLRDVTDAYDQVVLDSGPLLAVADTTLLLAETEAALICVRSQRTTQDQAAALKQAVERLPHRLIGVVVTGVKPGTDDELGYYAYESTV